MRRLCLLPLVLALACTSKDENPLNPDAGSTAAPTVSSVSPDLGPKAGGTIVSVLGTNFVQGARLFLGDAEATNVVWVSDRRITGRTTPSAVSGALTATVVNPDGKQGTLSKAFEYIPPPSERTSIDSCTLMLPLSLTTGTGSLSDPVSAGVTAIGVTDSAGQGAKIEGQLGYGPPDAGVESSFWTWIPANYNDSSGSTYDTYSAQLIAPAIGQYRYAFRFNYNGGDWTYCDFDGSENGFDLSNAGPMYVHSPMVQWCATTNPKALVSKPGVPATLPDGGAAQITAEAYQPNSTTTSGNEGDYVAQVGVGPANAGIGSAAWTWSDATFVTGGAGQFGNNYQWTGTITGPNVSGDYLFGYRISLRGGDWQYCGLDNPIASSSTLDLGTLSAVGQATPDYCQLETTSLTGTAGQASGSATSRVYKGGLTTDHSGGAASQIQSQIGFGPTGKGPVDGTWSWSDATFSAAGTGQFGNDYRYQGSITAPSAGSYLYTFRYNINGGPWTYCDSNGIADGGSTANLGTISVSAATGPQIACRLESLSTGVIGSGAQVNAVGRVTLTGVTDSTGQGPGILMQIGTGTAGSPPNGAGWTWRTASFLGDGDAGSDMYQGSLTPAYTGNRAVTFRASNDDGGTWSNCSTSTVPDAGVLVVGNFAGGPGDPAYCTLQYPTPINGGTQTAAGFSAYGQVYAAGTTDQSAYDGGAITAQFGVGQASEDPGASANWTWYPTDFNTGHDPHSNNNFEYTRVFPDAGSGSFNYAFRYRLTGSTGPWCYGDQADNGGNGNGFAAGDLGAATLP